MIAQVDFNGKCLKFDLLCPLDLSIPVVDRDGVNAWYIPRAMINHVEVNGYIGKVSLGGSTNFNNIFFNPHSHGTHTECVGHISEAFHSINDQLPFDPCMAQLMTVSPLKVGEDTLIARDQIAPYMTPGVAALIIRTLPNGSWKKKHDYSNTNPAFLAEEAVVFLRNQGVQHLLVDLPSVDKEQDGGALASHHAWWNYPDETRHDATITEFIFVSDEVTDGLYLLDLQVAPFDNDAAPSRPILYPLV